MAVSEIALVRFAEFPQRRPRGGAVRYASPAFWSRTDFDLRDENRHVLVKSAFVAPSLVKKHKKWMYTSPSGRAVLNPEPE